MRVVTVFARTHARRHAAANDEALSRAAQSQFQAVQKAHDVLTNEGHRHIYDQYGEEGLKQAWALIQHDPTVRPDEVGSSAPRARARRSLSTPRLRQIEDTIRQNKLDELEKQQNGNVSVKGLVQIETSVNGLRRVVADGDQSFGDVSGVTIAQTTEVQVTDNDTITVGGSLNVEGQSGLGSALASWKRKFSDSAFGWMTVSSEHSSADGDTFIFSTLKHLRVCRFKRLA